MAEACAPDVRLEAHLPGRDRLVEGRDEVAAELNRWYGGPAPVAWLAGLLGPEAQRPGADGRPVRQSHWLHLDDDGRIGRHVVYCHRPAPAGGMAHRGQAGALIEHRDGRVVKHLDRSDDWTMRATHDTGREAALWLDGPLGSGLPPGVATAIVDAGPDRIVMRDVTEHLVAAVPFGLTEADCWRIVAAIAAVHRAFADRPPAPATAGLCDLADRIGLLSPATAEAERDELRACPSCGAPTTAEVCAFCKLVDRASAPQAVRIGRRP